jgi:energy-coupling factor transporter ATP-binding protein EcfA2
MHALLMPIARTLGIEALLKKYPYEVSGGQKQRAAVARALITSPRIILADEPTGALDSRSTDELLRLFSEVNRQGQTLLMVTHSARAASRARRVLFIRDGEVFHQLYRGEASAEKGYLRVLGRAYPLQLLRAYPSYIITRRQISRAGNGPLITEGAQVRAAYVCHKDRNVAVSHYLTSSPIRLRASLAASCSAVFLERPVPSPITLLLSST